VKNVLREDETPVTPRQFKERMTLESIAVSPNGKFEFTFDDGQLFWGHVIQVSGSLSKGPTNAHIVDEVHPNAGYSGNSSGIGQPCCSRPTSPS
jgi:hypothetical protein